MVLLIIIPMKNGYFIGNINPTFSDKPKCEKCGDQKFMVAFPHQSVSLQEGLGGSPKCYSGNFLQSYGNQWLCRATRG